MVKLGYSLQNSCCNNFKHINIMKHGIWGGRKAFMVRIGTIVKGWKLKGEPSWLSILPTIWVHNFLPIQRMPQPGIAFRQSTVFQTSTLALGLPHPFFFLLKQYVKPLTLHLHNRLFPVFAPLLSYLSGFGSPLQEFLSVLVQFSTGNTHLAGWTVVPLAFSRWTHSV